jgi:hypothetical protein
VFGATYEYHQTSQDVRTFMSFDNERSRDRSDARKPKEMRKEQDEGSRRLTIDSGSPQSETQQKYNGGRRRMTILTGPRVMLLRASERTSATERGTEIQHHTFQGTRISKARGGRDE